MLGVAVSSDSLLVVPDGVVAYVDGYGNLKTTWTDPDLEPGEEVQVRVGEVTAVAIAGAVTLGDLSFAPGSSGWLRQTALIRRDGSEVRWWELLRRGGSAAQLFGRPATGTQVEILGRA